MGGGLSSLSRNTDVGMGSGRGQASTISSVNNIDIICHYSSLKNAFAEYLQRKDSEQYLILYETILKAEQSSDKNQVSQIEKILKTISSVSTPNKRKHQSILSNNKTEDGDIHYASTKREVESILLPIIDEFQNSDIFATAIRPKVLRISISHKEKSVLFASSHSLVTQIVNKMLVELHYRVQIVDTGDAALAELMSQPYDYALLSLELPGKSGLKVVQEVVRLEDICRTKIQGYIRPVFVYMTTKPEDNIKDSAHRAGFVGGLIVPFKQNKLEEFIPSNNFMRSMSRKISL